MGSEQPASYYDLSAANPEKYFNLPPTECCLYPVWRAVVREIQAGARVLDLGCGAGHLAWVAHAEGADISSWLGLDFSEGLVGIANRRRFPSWFKFSLCDVVLGDWVVPAGATVVATDFLEHIEEDLSVVERIRSGSRVVFSLPPHDHETHVRYFPTIGSAVERYEPLVLVQKVEVVGPSIVLTGVRR
jgi:SAM-dependent methyltransferase